MQAALDTSLDHYEVHTYPALVSPTNEPEPSREVKMRYAARFAEIAAFEALTKPGYKAPTEALIYMRAVRNWALADLMRSPMLPGKRRVDWNRVGKNKVVLRLDTYKRHLENQAYLNSTPLHEVANEHVATIPLPEQPVLRTARPRDIEAYTVLFHPAGLLYRKRGEPIYVTKGGRCQRLAKWAAELGKSYSTLYVRFRRGWSDIDILDGRSHSGPRRPEDTFYRAVD